MCDACKCSSPTWYTPPSSIRRMNREMRREHKGMIRWMRRHLDRNSIFYIEPTFTPMPEDDY